MAGGGESQGSARVRHTWHIGAWGNPYEGGGQPSKGTITYAISPNRQNPWAGAVTKGVFNTWRRFRNQVFYIAPPFLAAYYAMGWAIERNEYLNSKPGRAEFAEESEE